MKKWLFVIGVSILCMTACGKTEDAVTSGDSNLSEEQSVENQSIEEQNVENQLLDLLKQECDKINEVTIFDAEERQESYDLWGGCVNNSWLLETPEEIREFFSLFNNWDMESNLVPKSKQVRIGLRDGLQKISIEVNDEIYILEDIYMLDENTCCGEINDNVYYLPYEVVEYLENCGIVFQKWRMYNKVRDVFIDRDGSLRGIHIYYMESGADDFRLQWTQMEAKLLTGTSRCIDNLLSLFVGWDMKKNKVPRDEILDIKQKYFISFDNDYFTLSYAQEVDGKYYGAINGVPYYMPEAFGRFLEECDDYYEVLLDGDFSWLEE